MGFGHLKIPKNRTIFTLTTATDCSMPFYICVPTSGQSCVRNFCLPNCNLDSQCSLGERCVDNSCIKICFYDAHCLAGEFCEKSGNSTTAAASSGPSGNPGGNNGICVAGCRRGK